MCKNLTKEVPYTAYGDCFNEHGSDSIGGNPYIYGNCFNEQTSLFDTVFGSDSIGGNGLWSSTFYDLNAYCGYGSCHTHIFGCDEVGTWKYIFWWQYDGEYTHISKCDGFLEIKDTTVSLLL